MVWQNIEEIRLRVNQPAIIKLREGQMFLGATGLIAKDQLATKPALMMTKDMISRMVMLLSRSSIYAFEEELRQGFITVKGGHRVGFGGEAVVEAGVVKTLKNITAINFRVAKEVKGAAKIVLPYVFASDGELWQTLIISPPRIGKTTVLRDLARELGAEFDVALADERYELAAAFEGVPQLDVGRQTDVLSGCPKATATMLLLRSMAPQVIITDEIGSMADSLALTEALNAGVKVVASAHGSSYAEVLARPALGALLSGGYFKRVLVLARQEGQVVVSRAYDHLGKPLPKTKPNLGKNLDNKNPSGFSIGKGEKCLN